MDDQPEKAAPWERQEYDTDASFRAFQVYLELGRERALRQAYRQRYGNETATAVPGYFGAWASEHRWQERARAWDDHVWSETLASRARRIEELRESIFPDAPDLIDALKKIGKGDLQPTSSEQRHAALALLKILGVDKPPETVRHEHSGPGGGPIDHRDVTPHEPTREEAAAILRTLQEAGGLEAVLGLEGEE